MYIFLLFFFALKCADFRVNIYTNKFLSNLRSKGMYLPLSIFKSSIAAVYVCKFISLCIEAIRDYEIASISCNFKRCEC